MLSLLSHTSSVHQRRLLAKQSRQGRVQDSCTHTKLGGGKETPSSRRAFAATTASATGTSTAAKSSGLTYLSSRTLNPLGGGGVAKWIFGTAGMVVGMIHVGGVTRLTQSGLSMTTWSPLGSLPPITKEQWETEFRRYQQFPEFEQRKSMTLSEFKYIYAWEYGHRMLGRITGLVFCAPWIYFTVRGRIPKGYQLRMAALGTMGATQGLVGWWMVKSGLGEDRRGDRKEIRVKPIRLAAHLTMAVATYGALLWTGLDLLSLPHIHSPNKNGGTGALESLAKQLSSMGRNAIQSTTRLRAGSMLLAGLTTITITSGALVAGNDAGRAYNTFPKMDDAWIPDDILELAPWHRNLLENTATVQWNHRLLGTATASTALALSAVGLGRAQGLLITPQVRKGLMAVGLAATGQFALGVSTLLYYVPISLAAAHQLGSIVVFTSSIYLAHSLRYAKPALLRAVKAV